MNPSNPASLETGPVRTRSAGPGRNGAVKAAEPVGKVNILLVDDRPEKLLALEACLSSLGQNLVRANSGKEALRYLLRQEFAVILLDVSMPTMDGFETAGLIRQRPKTEHVPIIFVTSLNDSEKHIFQGYSLGAVDYILSPIVPDVLRTKVSVFVDLYKKAEQIRLQGEQLRKLEEAEHRRKLAEVADRLEIETRRNRFFTLALDLLAIADFDGCFLQINPVWEKVLGFSEEELKSKCGLDFVHPEEHAAMAAQLDQLRNGQCATYFEGRYRCKDGSYRWLAWTASPFVSERLIYIFARDITTRKQHEAAIQELNQQLERRVGELTEANAELEAFNYTISHDLRSPLRSMQGFAQALIEDCSAELSPTGRNYTGRIMSSSQYMDILLQDLLKYSRLSRAEMDRSNLDLDQLTGEVLDNMSTEIAGAGAMVEVQRPLLAVYGNRSTLKQIITNLISNAVKFVESGVQPRVRISTESREGLVRLWIEDNGIGIAPEHQQRIFGLFERLHGANSYPGTGVGLAIVRKAVERMHGRVGVISKSGEGSRFWIDLPGPTSPENEGVAPPAAATAS
ncbi:MAG: ATP-binding protein [Verrucomicrobia subdivision 3 bacterium]|nr:ATP-binding protein [Limisphaerales bacterium]